MKNWLDIKEYLIAVYGRVVLILTCLSLLVGLFMSFVVADSRYGFNGWVFLFGIVVTIFTVALTSGLLLIQIQNNELLKEINCSSGYVVDIGASDGIIYSSTLPFFKNKRWIGLDLGMLYRMGGCDLPDCTALGLRREGEVCNRICNFYPVAFGRLQSIKGTGLRCIGIIH